jgi:hypothetical protein
MMMMNDIIFFGNVEKVKDKRPIRDLKIKFLKKVVSGISFFCGTRERKKYL